MNPLSSIAPANHTRTLLAIDVGGTKTQAASYDLATGALRRCRLETHAPDLRGVAALHRLIDGVQRELGIDASTPLLGIAAVFPGVMRGQHLLLAPNTPGLEGMNLFEELAAAFACTSITLDNDVKAGALAEHAWGALRGSDPSLYLNVGTGLAAAAMIGGEVYRGRNGAALEIGYQLTPATSVLPPEHWRGWRDGVAPMESAFSGASLDALARQALGDGHRAEDLFASDDPKIRHELQRRIHALAAQLVNLAIALDVERIAIGGGINRQFALFEATLSGLLDRLVPFPPMLARARFGNDAPLWGALELARRAAGLPALPAALFEDTTTGAAEPASTLQRLMPHPP
ncbi:ROK family protein [Dyella sp. 2RAB6]|uniref:ROK family protein n=1 Tax=Dyella sp. 2RAB6 TaxID=3232992 RepID=UPI003F908288